MSARQDLRIVIVGGGFGGVAAAIELQNHGFRDITILERAADFGGTWFHNSYPGAACDVPSHLYSFSYAQRRDWSRLCSPQQEILDYIHEVARAHGVDKLVRPNTAVSACNWDDDAREWTITSSDGETFTADAVLVATGQLHQESYPSIPGLDDFKGHSFHSASWDHDYDLRGKRIAVVGTGASAVQFVPEIQPTARRLVIFQRTGNWFMARNHKPYSALFKAIVKNVPGVQAYRRRFIFNYGESLTLMIRHPRTWGRLGHLRSAMFMRKQLKDPDVRRKVWPDYTFGCKRVLFSSDWLPALQKPNVDVVTDAITSFTEKGVKTADGTEHEVDCVIWGTGFKTTDFMFPMEITGAGGTSLRDAWAGGPHALHGITIPGFPSLFVMYGPNTNTSGGSIIVYLEAQAAYIRQALEQVRDRGAAAIEVRADVEAAADKAVQERFAGTAWLRCDSWYRDESGRIVANWPGYMREYVNNTAVLDPSEYEFVPLAGRDLHPAAKSASIDLCGSGSSAPACRACAQGCGCSRIRSRSRSSRRAQRSAARGVRTATPG